MKYVRIGIEPLISPCTKGETGRGENLTAVLPAGRFSLIGGEFSESGQIGQVGRFGKIENDVIPAPQGAFLRHFIDFRNSPRLGVRVPQGN